MNNITAVNDAMSRHLDGEPHTPEKITFKYLKHTISDMSKQVERRKGARYTVIPFQLLINDGNYYVSSIPVTCATSPCVIAAHGFFLVIGYYGNKV